MMSGQLSTEISIEHQGEDVRKLLDFVPT